MSNSPEFGQLETQLLLDIAAAADLAALDEVRVAALGKSGSVSALMAGIAKQPADQKKAYGAAVNAVTLVPLKSLCPEIFRAWTWYS